MSCYELHLQGDLSRLSSIASCQTLVLSRAEGRRIIPHLPQLYELSLNESSIELSVAIE